MAVPGVVELPLPLNANGVLDDIIALPPPQNPHKAWQQEEAHAVCLIP